jgi:iron complex transport system substrate-binding protein
MKSLLITLVLLLATGQTVLAAEPIPPPKRIVSLAPSMTEILFALGLGDRIVGVTSFCDYPEATKTKPKIGGMSNPSLEAVVSLKPDLVVMTTDGNPKEFEERLRSLKIKIYVFTARRIAELPKGYRDLGALLHVPKQAETLAQEIEKTLTRFGPGVMGQGARNAKKKVLFIVWPDPLIVAGPGTAMDDAITMLGQQNIAGDAVSTYPKYSLEEVIRRAPDVLVIGKATGMDIRTVSKGILQRMASVPAIKNNAVCYVSDNLFRLGPRVVPGIGELATCLK